MTTSLPEFLQLERNIFKSVGGPKPPSLLRLCRTLTGSRKNQRRKGHSVYNGLLATTLHKAEKALFNPSGFE